MACLAASDRTTAEDALGSLPLRRMNPFRMIAVFPKSLEVIEWRWDRERLAMESMGWRTWVWISSGLDEAGAQRERGLCFEQACQERDSGSLDWLRRFHQSHRPERGPYSVCMHRADAATVSYTEIGVEGDLATLRHSQGALCQCGAALSELQLAPVGNRA